MLARCPTWLSILCALALTGCQDSSAGAGGRPLPSLVAVSPEYFLGGVPCVDDGPGMKRYSATLIDVTEDLPSEDFELPSSNLVSCRQEVAFSFVVPEHRYIAEVRGYDRKDLEPESPGSPKAVDGAGRLVPPRYSTRCGYRLGAGGEGGAGAGGEGGAGAGDEPALEGAPSVESFIVYASYCLPLSDDG